MDDQETIYADFGDNVNMTGSELHAWLETDESRAAGDSDSGESTGHKSGRRIVEILDTNKGDLSEDDYAHMRKVNGYIARHLQQKPDKPDDELRDMAWTHSLKNWGHDPLKPA